MCLQEREMRVACRCTCAAILATWPHLTFTRAMQPRMSQHGLNQSNMVHKWRVLTWPMQDADTGLSKHTKAVVIPMVCCVSVANRKDETKPP